MVDSGLPPDPYNVLGVKPDAELPEIRSAHRKLVLKCHPDKFTDPILKAYQQDKFQKVQQAYKLLSNEWEREKYDERVRLATLENEMEEKRRPRKGAPVPHNNKKRPGILVVHGRINNRDIHAIPDTGAEYNIIAASFASTLGLEVRNHSEGTEKQLRMANGKHIQTRGTVEADWCFSAPVSQNDDGNKYESSAPEKGKGTWRLVFHVLSDFVYDLVLGHSFLMETETMSRFKERLSRIPRPHSALSVMRVNLMGVPSQRVRGVLGKDKSILALPDSGSEPNLLSWDYVKRQGWAVTSMDMRDQRLLQFADGSVGRTEGSITARWAFAPGKGGSKSSQAAREGLLVELHVLRDCPYDMILGQDVLEETDAFLKYHDAFEYVESDTAASATNLVIFARKKTKNNQARETNTTAADLNHRSALHEELQRRAESDRQRRRDASDNQERRQRQHQGPEGGRDNYQYSYRDYRPQRRLSRRPPFFARLFDQLDNHSVGDSTSTFYSSRSSTSSQIPKSSASSTITANITVSKGEKGKNERHTSFLEQEIKSEAKFNSRITPQHAHDTNVPKIPVTTYVV